MGAGCFAQKRGGGYAGKAPFLNFFYARCRPPHPRLAPYTPEVETPAPSAPGTTAHHRQQDRPCQMQGRPRKARHTPGRWTRCTGLHSIPNRPRRADRNGGGRWRAGSASETVQIRTLEQHTKTGLKIITFSCMFVACATLQIH